jgi:hypothetical protein
VRRAYSRHQGRGWLIAAHAIGLFCVIGFLLNFHRIPVGARTPETFPEWPAGTKSPAALVVSRARLEAQAASPPAFSERDWSLAWLNTLEQEIGPCGLLDVGDVSEAGIEDRALLVLSASTRGKLGDEARAALDAWVRAGGALIVELPDPALSSLTGLDRPSAAGRAAPARPLRAAASFLPARAGLGDLPIYTRRSSVAARAAHGEILAWLEDDPAVFAQSLGRGWVVSVLFDFGLFLTATQQGRPEEDYTVESRHEEILRPQRKSADLMVSIEFHDNAVPVADLLERALIQWVRQRTVIPAFWYWPDGAPGVYLMTHDDEAFGAKAEWMPADETARGVPSTCFYIGTGTTDPASLARVHDGGHSIGIHWDREMREVEGLRYAGPWLREISIERQVARLRGRLPDSVAVRVSRTHYLLWDESYARTFAQLAALGIEMDSSYGPDFNCKGYLFGTAYPFHPFAETGLPFRLLELPYQHSEREAGCDSAYLSGLARESLAGDHAAIVSLFHPPFWLWAPSADTYRLWRQLPLQMAALGHPALTMEALVDFAQSRAGAEVSIEDEASDRLVIVVNAPEGIEGLFLTLPSRIGDRRVSVDGMETRELASLGGTRWLGFPVRGSGRYLVRLETVPIPEPETASVD